MYFVDVIAAILIALFFTLLLALALRMRGPWGSLWTIFLVILLGVWAASLWIEPAGPVYWNIAWIPLLTIGLILALVLIAATPTANEQRRLSTEETDENSEASQNEKKTIAAVSAFFWILLIILAITIIIGYAV